MTGVSEGAAAGKDFVKVSPALVRELGSASKALVWSRVRYRTESTRHAHELADGTLWWAASYDDIALEVGLSHDQVKGVLLALVRDGYLLSAQLHGNIRTVSYRPVIEESQRAESPSPSGETALSIGRNHPMHGAKLPDAPSTKTLRQLQDVSTSDVAVATPDFAPEVIALCALLAELVQANGHRVGTVGKVWWSACERLMRLDGFTADQIEIIARWATADEFWSANIRSMPTLREKFSTLRAQRNRKLDGKKPSTIEHGRDVDAILRARQAQQQLAVSS